MAEVPETTELVKSREDHINELLSSDIDANTLQQLLQAVRIANQKTESVDSAADVDASQPDQALGYGDDVAQLEQGKNVVSVDDDDGGGDGDGTSTNDEVVNGNEHSPDITSTVVEDDKDDVTENNIVISNSTNETLVTDEEFVTPDSTPDAEEPHVLEPTATSPKDAAQSTNSSDTDMLGKLKICNVATNSPSIEYTSPPPGEIQPAKPEESQPVISIDFDSVVPPVLLPIAKVKEYLPKGYGTGDTGKPIPLPYKPMMLIKDQIAAMVFAEEEPEKEHKAVEGLTLTCKECRKKIIKEQQPEQEQQQPLAQQQLLLQPRLLQQQQPFSQQWQQTLPKQALPPPALQQPLSQLQQPPQQQQQPLQPQQQTSSSQQSMVPQQQQQQFANQVQFPQQQQPLPQQSSQQPMVPQQQQFAGQMLPQQQQQPISQQPLQQHPLPSQQQFTGQVQSQPPSPLQQQQQLPAAQPIPPQQQPPGQVQFPQQQYHARQGFPTNVQSPPNAASLPTNNAPGGLQRSGSVTTLPGLKPPVWQKNEESKHCNHCSKPFTVTRRKHHCRGCGQIYCSDCCNQLAQLPYLKFNIARICITCTQSIKKARAEKMKKRQQQKVNTSKNPMPSPLPVKDSLLCAQPYSQNSDPALMENGLDALGSLASSNFMPSQTQKYNGAPSTISNFMPNMESSSSSVAGSFQVSYTPQDAPPPSVTDGATSSSYNSPASVTLYDADFVPRAFRMPLRPAGRTITWMEGDAVVTEEQKKRFLKIAKELKNSNEVTVQAAVELSIAVKKIKVVIKQGMHEAWFLCSNGFSSCGQKEIAFILEKKINEEAFPFGLLKIYRTIYSMALNQGDRFEHGNYLAFTNSLFGSENNKGLLFVSTDILPQVVQHHFTGVGESLLCCFLVKQSELPCAKYLPTRLLIAMGVQQQCYPCPAISSRDRSSVCNMEPNELFFSTFVTVNKFLNYKTPQALIPGVHILKCGGKIALELPIAYQTEIISLFDSLFVDDDSPVTIPIAGDLASSANGHFVYSPSNMPSVRRGFVVLRNNNNGEVDPGNQYLAFSSIILVLSFGGESTSRTKFGVEVIEDGIRVTLAGSQAREIRQSIYQGTNCSMYVGNAATQDQFVICWTDGEWGGGMMRRSPKTVVRKQESGRRTSGYKFTPNTPAPATPVSQTNVIIDLLQTRNMENATQTNIVGDPTQAIRKLENDVRQACASSLYTFANRLRPNAEKRLSLTLVLSPGCKKWSLGPTNQPINLARALQLALNDVDVPQTNGEIVFVFNVLLQKTS